MYGGLSGLAVSNGVEGPASGAAAVAVTPAAAVDHVSDVATQNSAHRGSHAPVPPLGRRGHCDV